MIKQANIKMPLACWKEIKGTKVEYNLLDDGTIEHVIIRPEDFFDDKNNPMEWIAARVRVSEDDLHNITIGWDTYKSVFCKNYYDLLEISFEI